MRSSFRVLGLRSEALGGLLELSDEDLRARSALRMTVKAKPGYPCRVSLVDADVGEEVILTPFEHLAVDSPYRAQGAIFVREGATTAEPAVDEIPEMLTCRPISVRAYDGEGMMVDAGVVHGEAELRESIDQMLGLKNPGARAERVAILHLHNAGAGCFNCRVERA